MDADTRAIGGLRNRAAHNEPIFSTTGANSVASVHAKLVGLLSMLNPDLGTYVSQTSTVASVLARRP